MAKSQTMKMKPLDKKKLTQSTTVEPSICGGSTNSCLSVEFGDSLKRRSLQTSINAYYNLENKCLHLQIVGITFAATVGIRQILSIVCHYSCYVIANDSYFLLFGVLTTRENHHRNKNVEYILSEVNKIWVGI